MKKAPEVQHPSRCPQCSNFMNWELGWGNLWRCMGCGEIVAAGESISSRQAVEDAIAAAKRQYHW